jgi:hypothetical protein
MSANERFFPKTLKESRQSYEYRGIKTWKARGENRGQTLDYEIRSSSSSRNRQRATVPGFDYFTLCFFKRRNVPIGLHVVSVVGGVEIVLVETKSADADLGQYHHRARL